MDSGGRLKLKVDHTVSGEGYPVLARFVDCIPERLGEVLNQDEIEPESLSVKVLRSDTNSILSLGVGGEVYNGKPDARFSDASAVRYVVGAVSRRSKTITLAEVEGEYLLRANRASSREAEKEAELFQLNSVTRQHLVEQFGGQRGKKQLHNKIEGRVTTEKISASEATALKQNLALKKERTSTSISSPLRDVPPHDKAAAAVEKAYPLQGLIAGSEWKEVLDTSKEMCAHLISDDTKQLKENYGLLDFTLNLAKHIENLSDFHKDAKVRSKAMSALYLNYLLRFNSDIQKVLKRSAANQIEEMILVPRTVAERLSSDFLHDDPQSKGNQKLTRAGNLNDRLYGYILVLWLTVVGFEGDPSAIAKILKMTPTRCLLHFKHLGCTVGAQKRKKDTERKYFTKLTVPLQFPDLKRRRISAK